MAIIKYYRSDQRDHLLIFSTKDKISEWKDELTMKTVILTFLGLGF